MKYSLRSLIIVVLVLPPLIGGMWFWLRFEEVRELAIDALGWLAAIAFLCFLAFLMRQRWKNRHESSREYLEEIQEKKAPIVIQSCEPPNPSAPLAHPPNP